MGGSKKDETSFGLFIIFVELLLGYDWLMSAGFISFSPFFFTIFFVLSIGGGIIGSHQGFGFPVKSFTDGS